MKQEKQCPVCKTMFEPTHGNHIYCSDACYDENKSKEQKENGRLIKQFRSAFISNHAYFKELLPEPGRIELPLLRLMKKGFDQDAYYGTALDKNQIRWHRVNEYAFSIIQKENQLFLQLYKK